MDSEEEDLVLMCLLICEENTRKRKKTKTLGFSATSFHAFSTKSFLILFYSCRKNTAARFHREKGLQILFYRPS